jgi:hypothetical protein
MIDGLSESNGISILALGTFGRLAVMNFTVPFPRAVIVGRGKPV